MTRAEWLHSVMGKKLRHRSYRDGQYVVPTGYDPDEEGFRGIKYNKNGVETDNTGGWNLVPSEWTVIKPKCYLPECI